MSKYVTILMTAPSEEEGEKIAKKLVEELLVACVNIVPRVRSIYRWEGKVCNDEEVMMVAKTASTMAPAVVSRVKELHSYDVPEIICLPIETGSGDYLDWIGDSVAVPSGKDVEGEI